MTEWLVTVCLPGDTSFKYGPSVIVEAASAQEAANKGVEALAQEESGTMGAYGVECQHCENVAVESVSVLPMEQARVFMQHTLWGAAE